MSLSSIVNITISSNSRGVSRKSFGVPLVIGQHAAWPELYREYSLGTALSSLVTDGIVVGSPIYKQVESLASNTPKPEKVIVGRLAASYSQIFKLTVKAAVETGTVYSFDLRAPNGGAVTTISYTAVALDTPTLVGAALNALVTAVSGLTSTATAGVLTVKVDDDNKMWQVEGLDVRLMGFEDTTADSSLVTNLTSIQAAYPDFYGVLLADCQSKARITALAAWAETQEVIFGATSFDTENLTTGTTTSVMYALNAAKYFRTFVIYSGDQTKRAAACWIGSRFAIAPGASTWAYKALSGVTRDKLTDAQIAAIKASSGNYYVEIAGVSVTLDGKTAAGEWIDVIRGRDWLKVRMQERVFGDLVNSPKIPYTNKGAGVIATDVEAQLAEGVGATYLSDTPEPFVTYPDVSTVSTANKNARLLPDVYFEATLAGAIHAVTIAGNILS